MKTFLPLCCPVKPSIDFVFHLSYFPFFQFYIFFFFLKEVEIVVSRYFPLYDSYSWNRYNGLLPTVVSCRIGTAMEERE